MIPIIIVLQEEFVVFWRQLQNKKQVDRILQLNLIDWTLNTRKDIVIMNSNIDIDNVSISFILLLLFNQIWNIDYLKSYQ